MAWALVESSQHVEHRNKKIFKDSKLIAESEELDARKNPTSSPEHQNWILVQVWWSDSLLVCSRILTALLSRVSKNKSFSIKKCDLRIAKSHDASCCILFLQISWLHCGLVCIPTHLPIYISIYRQYLSISLSLSRSLSFSKSWDIIGDMYNYSAQLVFHWGLLSGPMHKLPKQLCGMFNKWHIYTSTQSTRQYAIIQNI